MTIDEKLEALTHSVELLASMQIQSEKRMEALAERMEELAARTVRLQDSMATMAEGMATLTRITLDRCRAHRETGRKTESAIK